MSDLIKNWVDVGNAYGTVEGGWKTMEEAREAIRMVERETELHVEDDFGIIGRMGDDGWEPAYPDTSYDLYCLTSNDGEWLLQPGEDDGERTEEGVNRVAPPKGWVWVCVA